jgi:hypothetical protein
LPARLYNTGYFAPPDDLPPQRSELVLLSSFVPLREGCPGFYIVKANISFAN